MSLEMGLDSLYCEACSATWGMDGFLGGVDGGFVSYLCPLGRFRSILKRDLLPLRACSSVRRASLLPQTGSSSRGSLG